jgi:hypothetical protein
MASEEMDASFDLISKRAAGHVRVGFTTYYDQPLPEVLARFGLRNEEFLDPRLREISREEASHILVSLIRLDMAYHAPLMSDGDAETLAQRFLVQFPSDGTRFLTNLGRTENVNRPFDVGTSPMTQSTFDGGVICLAKPVAGCVWFEDED